MARVSLQQLRHSYLPDPARESDWALKNIDLQWEVEEADAQIHTADSVCTPRALHAFSRRAACTRPRATQVKKTLYTR